MAIKMVYTGLFLIISVVGFCTPIFPNPSESSGGESSFSGYVGFGEFKMNVQGKKDTGLAAYFIQNLRREILSQNNLKISEPDDKSEILERESSVKQKSQYDAVVQGSIVINNSRVVIETRIIQAGSGKSLFHQIDEWEKNGKLFKRLDRLTTQVARFLSAQKPLTKEEADFEALAALNAPTIEGVKLLMLPFQNVTQEKKYDWMRDSLKVSMSKRLSANGKFIIVEPTSAQLKGVKGLAENIAAGVLAEQNGCEVAVTTKYAVFGKKIRIESMTVVGKDGKILHLEKADSNVDSGVFSGIDKISDLLVEKIPGKIGAWQQKTALLAAKRKLEEAQITKAGAADISSPPAKNVLVSPPVEITAGKTPPETLPASTQGIEKKSRLLPEVQANFFLANALPVGVVSEHLGYSLGLRADARMKLFNWMQNFFPYASAQSFYSGGRTVSGMFFMAASLGLTYPILLRPKAVFLPHVAMGYSGGRLFYQGGYPFALPSLDLGLTIEVPAFQNWHFTVALVYYTLLDKYLNISFIQMNIGLGATF
jgi:TolB-like protein